MESFNEVAYLRSSSPVRRPVSSASASIGVTGARAFCQRQFSFSPCNLLSTGKLLPCPQFIKILRGAAAKAASSPISLLQYLDISGIIFFISRLLYDAFSASKNGDRSLPESLSP